ncbi:unnamed protein product [Pleuronectes platessa]|uniref:Uncharacterized protein n=1 Tax=Pleuronectes platessa TaxID=8262 RepID=A0A9N7W4A1_PLEPL|nr:unnamed protein product [Pleuronectes platessa]
MLLKLNELTLLFTCSQAWSLTDQQQIQRRTAPLCDPASGVGSRASGATCCRLVVMMAGRVEGLDPDRAAGQTPTETSGILLRCPGRAEQQGGREEEEGGRGEEEREAGSASF